MKLDMFNIRDFIKINKLVPVTSPISLTPTKMPSNNGIFSYEIFGYTSDDRKNTFSYIELNGKFLHPQAYKTLQRMGSLGKIVTREKYAIVVNGKIHITTQEEHSDAETGLEFFYNNWEKINWNTTSVTTSIKEVDEDDLSLDKKNRFRFFSLLKKDEVFIDCWLVLPPFYRDVNTEDSTMGDDINKLYNELISRANSLKSGFGFTSFSNITKTRIQQLINMIYDITMGPITGKSVDVKDNGTLHGTSKGAMIRRNLLGRHIDFGGYSVITAPLSSSAETVDDFVKFGTIKLPLQTFMSMTKPFFVNYCTDFFEKIASYIKKIFGSALVKIDSTQWSVTEIDKTLSMFIKTAAEKNTPIQIKIKYRDPNDKKIKDYVYIPIIIEAKSLNEEKPFKREMTYLDLFYIAAEEIAKDKYSINIRHPVTNYQNSYAAKMTVSATNKTRDIYINIPAADGSNDFKRYKHYPCIDDSQLEYKNLEKYSETDTDLVRATYIGNGIIKSLGADYDKKIIDRTINYIITNNDKKGCNYEKIIL